jgi:sulfide dehydrogenase cytochrome subunit
VQKHVLASVLLVVAGVSTAVAAPNDIKARGWAAGCFACHGPDGHSEGGMPTLAGRSAEFIYQALIDFKSGRRVATIMDRHAKGYSNEQLRRIAEVLGATNDPVKK